MKTLSEQIITVLKHVVSQYGSAAALCRASGVSQTNMSRWLKGVLPKTSEIEPVFNLLNIRLDIPGDNSRTEDIHYVSAGMSPASDGLQLPPSDNYIAIPTIDEIQARPGPISPIDIRDYFMVLRSLPTIRYKRNLIAVIKDKYTNSQLPLIRGGDIVIVDRDDCQPRDGDFMLVCYPQARGLLGAHGAICRVKDDGDTLIYYSDDKTCAPSVFSIDKDYGGDPRRALLGKILFCWSDMQGK